MTTVNVVVALTFSESAAFVVANRKTEAVVQNSRATQRTKAAWHRFDRKGPSTLDRQSLLAQIRNERE